MPRPWGARAAIVAGLIGCAVLLGVVGGALGTKPDLRLAASADGYATTTGERGSQVRLVAGGVGGGASVTYLKFDVTRAPRTPARAEVTLTRRAGALPRLIEMSTVPATSWAEDRLDRRHAPQLGSVVAVARPGHSDRSVRFDVSSVVKKRGTYAFAVTAPGGGLADFVDADGVPAGQGRIGPTLRVSWRDAVLRPGGSAARRGPRCAGSRRRAGGAGSRRCAGGAGARRRARGAVVPAAEPAAAARRARYPGPARSA
jgi:hypothetical protein